MATATAAATATAIPSYIKLTPREHILARPDSYVGSCESHKEKRWIFVPETGKMSLRTVDYNPGLYKIFDELVVNALDHVSRTAALEAPEKVTQITVVITPTTFSVQNNGQGIPIVEHSEYKVMTPELIFGHLLTSSNYDDAEEKTVGGKNGYGAKLTNIYSKTFIVETCDGKSTYEQTFTNNMLTVGKPKVTDKQKKPFTKITSTPDLTRFYGTAEATKTISPDMIQILRTRVIDMAALAAVNGCKVFMGIDSDSPTLVPVNSFEKYVRLFMNDGLSMLVYERCGPRWEVAAILTRTLHSDEEGGSSSSGSSGIGSSECRHISFVNGIYTKRGGKHVDAVVHRVLNSFCDGPGKKFGLTPASLKDSVTFFVNATIVNPSFDSQSKETLTTVATKFGSKFEISEGFVKRLAKEGGLLDEAKAVLDAKLSRESKKTDGKRVVRITGIPKLEDATLAGKGAEGAKCTLILTEGDSAASMAISGLSVVGRDRYGVFPLKGKSLNVRDASQDKKNDNVELTSIKRILGLVSGRHYTSLTELRYGRVMIMTDQDVDGSHIKGLLINMFHSEWPELLKLGFICCLMTPLIKATKGKKILNFYSASEYQTWLASAAAAAGGDAKGWSIKYYKGLGTSVASEAREYFQTMNTVRFTWDDAADESIDLLFRKDRTDDRKEWLNTYDRKRVLEIPAGGADVPYSRFIHDELIHFSVASNARAIPHIMDGLKPSQRKILWAARKRNLVSEIKVAQLGGYVSENAAYHHGEAALEETIKGMAQDFVGSNNINLLKPSGQFGTRLQGGDDSAASRYIFTALEPIQATLFHKADDAALSWVEDDGQIVEPEYYLPVLPMILVNGCSGMGTGYSTNIPQFNPVEIVSALRARLMATTETETVAWPTLTPWFHGFRGAVVPCTAHGKYTTNGKYTTHGIYTFTTDDSNRVRITELPVGVWTHTYKKFLDSMVIEGMECEAPTKVTKAKATATKTPKAKATKTQTQADTESVASSTTKTEKGKGKKVGIQRLVNYEFDNSSSDTVVNIWLTLEADYFHEARTFPHEFEKKFGLVDSITLTNMVAFDCNNKIRKYDSVADILEEFYTRRLEGYSSRKMNELKRLQTNVVEVSARVKFVKAVVSGELVVANAEDDTLLAGLKALELPALSLSSPMSNSLHGYEYLLRMRVDKLKAKSVIELDAELAALLNEIQVLESKGPEVLWLEDLTTFEEAYTKYCAVRDEKQTGSEPGSASGSGSGSTPSGKPKKVKVKATATADKAKDKAKDKASKKLTP